MEIIPAIMPRDWRDLEEKASLFAGLVDTIQIDIMDGIFVPEKTWPYAAPEPSFHELVGKERRLPRFDVLSYEADLMIARPEEQLKGWVESGIRRVIVHVEAVGDMEYFLKIVRHQKHPDIPHESGSGFEFGFAINIDTPIETLNAILDDDRRRPDRSIDFVQFMGISRIGYQGEPFDDRVLPKISDFRRRYGDILISVDGGVSLQSAPKLIAAGASRLAIGSALLKSGDIPGTIERFRKLERRS